MKLRPSLLLFIMFSSLLAAISRGESLKVGDTAPVVSGVTDSGTTLNLGDVYKDHTYTVVFFYPKALTGGCTKQGCSLRDANAELAKQGVAIVGVSTDPVEKQKEFKEVNHFPFPLIADTDKKIVKAFGQPAVMMASRECYVIKGGKIVYKDSGVTEKQGENVLAFLATQKA
jgi:peroxiredoxin Q/BCP